MPGHPLENVMETPILAPKKRTPFRTWAHMPGEDLVEMPRALALDLIRMADVSPFLHEATDDELDAELHYKRWDIHRGRMDQIMHTLSAHLCDEGLMPTADLMLRALVMSYEAARDIPKAVPSVDAMQGTA